MRRFCNKSPFVICDEIRLNKGLGVKCVKSIEVFNPRRLALVDNSDIAGLAPNPALLRRPKAEHSTRTAQVPRWS